MNTSKISCAFVILFTLLKGALLMTYPPNVKSLTVDGGDNVIIDEGQVVSVSCFFEKGNPPAHFYLLDKHGTKLNSSSSEGHLRSSLTARCEDDWPVVRCEGNGSQHNRSVTLLVKCRPQFIDKSTKVVNPALDTVTFGVKSHTTAVKGCLLTSVSIKHYTERGVNCTLTGHPPDLVLSLQLEKEEDSLCRMWTLTLSNDWGSSNPIFFIRDGSTQEPSPSSGKTINIQLAYAIVVTVVLILVVGTITIKKVKERRSVLEALRLKKITTEKKMPTDGSRDRYESVRGNLPRDTTL
ncbi:uncharacterized protein LOC112567434 isoform X2 [Pomacea canaliculata]|uniref:uncharacterized protein LOC112567434 isoform X2 n=1 Tax=Pomacea canaliculata TaxID=400727 RepID=UPI000D73C451|nr:uncharacterized protein LOC112567434 isoform X2 [Pomacea canaliculata]